MTPTPSATTPPPRTPSACPTPTATAPCTTTRTTRASSPTPAPSSPTPPRWGPTRASSSVSDAGDFGKYEVPGREEAADPGHPRQPEQRQGGGVRMEPSQAPAEPHVPRCHRRQPASADGVAVSVSVQPDDAVRDAVHAAAVGVDDR